MGIQLFVGGHAGTIQGEREDLVGDRMFSAAHRPQRARFEDCSKLIGIVDSGAFTDHWNKRLTPEKVLERQLVWEQKASAMWGQEWQAYALVSYDLLIDEVWTGNVKTKKRWSIAEAEEAVRVTVDAAAYLSSQRDWVSPRKLILSCQGVDSFQYLGCTLDVLKYATPDDWIGLGGWCILGRQKSWMSEFWATLYAVLPVIAAHNIKHIHIFGVLYLPALGGLLWLADKYGLTVSTDSTRPVLEATWPDRKKSGARFAYWRDNVNWWLETLRSLRDSKYYQEPPNNLSGRQLSLLDCG